MCEVDDFQISDICSLKKNMFDLNSDISD